MKIKKPRPPKMLAPKEYAHVIKKSLGLDRALRVSTQSAAHASQDPSLHGFWLQVVSILNKEGR